MNTVGCQHDYYKLIPSQQESEFYNFILFLFQKRWSFQRQCQKEIEMIQIKQTRTRIIK